MALRVSVSLLSAIRVEGPHEQFIELKVLNERREYEAWFGYPITEPKRPLQRGCARRSSAAAMDLDPA